MVSKISYAFPGHPVSKFVPSDVPLEKLALLGAATDWYANVTVQGMHFLTGFFRLDGLNKELDPW